MGSCCKDTESVLAYTARNLAANILSTVKTWVKVACSIYVFYEIQYNRDGVCSGLHSVVTCSSGLLRGGVAILNQRIKTNLYAIFEAYK
jgi:hypothetical protein